MLLLAADENLNNDIVRGLLRRKPDLDIVRVQDSGLSGKTDSIVLEWCANDGRVLLTHDVSTITKHAYDRVAAANPCPASLKSLVGCLSAKRLTTFFYSRNAASMANGKDRFAICRYGSLIGWVERSNTHRLSVTLRFHAKGNRHRRCLVG